MGKSKHRGKAKRRPLCVQQAASQSSDHSALANTPAAVLPRKRSGPKSRTSDYLGVTRYKRTGRWEAHIWDSTEADHKRGRQLHLGSFPAAQAAAVAYDRAAIKIRKEGATLNFPSTDYRKDEFLRDYGHLSKKEFIGKLRKWAQSAELLASLEGMCCEMQTAVRALNTKRSRRSQQVSSIADGTDTESLTASDNGDSAESQPKVRRSLRLRRPSDRNVELHTSELSASPGSVITSDAKDEGDPLWEPEPELQMQPALDTSVSELAGSENADVKLAASGCDTKQSPEPGVRYAIEDLTQEVLLAHKPSTTEAKTAAKPQQHKEEKAYPKSHSLSDAQRFLQQQSADRTGMMQVASLVDVEAAGGHKEACTMSCGCEEQGKDSLALSQTSILADFDQLESWAMPCAPGSAYKSVPSFGLGGYEPPQSPLNPGFSEQSAADMLTSPGALLKYEVDYSLCQEGQLLEGASLPAVMDLQFLTGASLYNQPIPGYSALYAIPSPVLPSSVVGLQHASTPWTVGMLPTPAGTLSPVPLQAQPAGYQLSSVLPSEISGQSFQADMQLPPCSPQLVPQMPGCEQAARVFDPDPAPFTRIVGEGPAAGVHRLVRAVQMRGQLHLDPSELAPHGTLSVHSPNNGHTKGQRSRMRRST